MKKVVLLFVVIAIIGISCSNRPNIKIEGEMHNGAKKVLYLEFLNINQTEIIDSFIIRKDNSFRFSFKAEYPGIYILRNESNKIITLLPSPGENLFLEVDYEKFGTKYSVSGSIESEYIRQLVEKLQDTRTRIKNLDDVYQPLSNLSEEQAANYIQQLKAINKEQRDFSIQFIIEHLSSIASIYAIYQEIQEGQYVLGENFDIQYMKIVADSTSKYYPEVPFVKSFVQDARSTEKKFYNLKTLSTKMKDAEVNSLDINLPGIDDKKVPLSSIKNKTVLLYLWSSKSQDCINLNPQLKKTYDKYKSKGLEVYAVGIEENKKAWNNIIKFEELDWINVYELTFPESETANRYNVKVLPASFLINTNGDIVARNIFGAELEKWLDNIL